MEMSRRGFNDWTYGDGGVDKVGCKRMGVFPCVWRDSDGMTTVGQCDGPGLNQLG